MARVPRGAAAGAVALVVLLAGLACTIDEVPPDPLPSTPPPEVGEPLPAPEVGEGRPQRDRHKSGKRKVKGGGGEPAPEPPDPEPAPRPTEIVCEAVGVYTACAEAGKPKTCSDEEVDAKGPGPTRDAAGAVAIEACEAHMATLMSFAGSGRGSATKKRGCAVTTCEP